MEQTEIINHKGEVVGNYQLNAKMWQTPLSHWNISLANRNYLARQRQGTSKVKTRGEVAGSTRKIYRQKGTGGARHGHYYAPQFRGGGRAFGPTGEENYSLDINRKFKKNVLQSFLGEKMRNKEIIIVDKITLNNYKTKEAEKLLNTLPTKKTKTLVVLANNEENKEKVICAFRNLPYIVISDSKLVNFSQIFSSKYLIFTHSAFSEVEKRLG